MANMIETDQLTLGSTNLEEYLTRQEPLTDARRKQLDSLINGAKRDMMNVERLPLILMNIERKQYPLISPEFLSLSSKIKIKDYEIQVPRFSVYRRSEHGFGDFRLEFKNKFGNLSDFFHKKGAMRLTFGHYEYHNRSPKPAEIFLNQLLKSFGSDFLNLRLSDEWVYYSKYTFKIKKNNPLYRLVDQLGELELSTKYTGVIPTNIKKKLKDIELCFGDQIYLVTENRPEDWNSNRLATDPLLLGLVNNQCYVLEHFDLSDKIELKENLKQ